MTKTNIVHDTITVIHRDTITIVQRDTILKVVEIVNKATTSKPSAFASFFNDYENFFSFLTAVAAIIAIYISIKAINKTALDSKRDILVAKFEDIYSLIYSLVPEYEVFLQLDKLMINSKNTSLSFMERQTNLSTYKAEISHLRSHTNVEQILEKVGRLKVLTNAYLDSELKKEILAFSMLFEYIIIVTTQNNSSYKKANFKNGFPTSENVKNLASKLADKLVEKINLGGKVEDKEKFSEYFTGEFQKEIGL